MIPALKQLSGEAGRKPIVDVMAEQQEGVLVIEEARGGNVQIGGNQRKVPRCSSCVFAEIAVFQVDVAWEESSVVERLGTSWELEGYRAHRGGGE